VGDDSFEIYPRKGEFFVFELPDGQRLEKILLPVPTKRTKGVLVFPTLDGRVTAGPTAVDITDKDDWSVRPEAPGEILPKAEARFPALEGLTPIAQYAGLRPAGRDANYIVGPSAANRRFINVAAIRSTGLSASLGIADYLTELLPDAGIEIGAQQPIRAGDVESLDTPWWQRTARFRTRQPATA
jgi:glycerol-3-phosphate dehydrogenase